MIGTSNSIPILDALWLLNGESIYGSITGAHNIRNFTVSNFLESNCKQWNENLIRHVSSDDMASAIL